MIITVKTASTGSNIISTPITYFILYHFSVINENGITIPPDPKPTLPKKKKKKNKNHNNDGWIEVPKKNKSNGDTASISSSPSTTTSNSDDVPKKDKNQTMHGIMKCWIEKSPNDSYGVIECKKFQGKENVEFFVHISELKFHHNKFMESNAGDYYLELTKAVRNFVNSYETYKCKNRPNVTFQIGNLKQKALNVRLHKPTYWKFNENGEDKMNNKTKK